jgi:hypothetical protein
LTVAKWHGELPIPTADYPMPRGRRRGNESHYTVNLNDDDEWAWSRDMNYRDGSGIIIVNPTPESYSSRALAELIVSAFVERVARGG